MIAAEVYRTSNGQLTRRFLLRLNSFGPWGQIAAQLFKAQKASKRAKKYGPYAGINGSSFRDLSYQRKGQALKDLCDLRAYADGSRSQVLNLFGEDLPEKPLKTDRPTRRQARRSGPPSIPPACVLCHALIDVHAQWICDNCKKLPYFVVWKRLHSA